MNNQAPRALVVDDEGLVSILIEEILKARGYEVTVANTRIQLEAALQRPSWNLVVTDTGFASHEEMQLWRADRIILCTGRSKDALEEQFPHVPYILKPCTEDDFDAVLQAAI